MGSVARMFGDVVVAIFWQWSVLGISPRGWPKDLWADLLRRVAFLWMATMPKATLQGSLGPKLAKTFSNAQAVDLSYLGPSQLVAPTAAIAILYMATVGSMLTFTIGKVLAVHLQKDEEHMASRRAGTSDSKKQLDVQEPPTTGVDGPGDSGNGTATNANNAGAESCV